MNPRNDCMSQMFHSSSQFWITATFARSMWSPVGVSLKPRYSMVSMWKLHFLGVAYSPASWRHLKPCHPISRGIWQNFLHAQHLYDTSEPPVEICHESD